MNRFCKDAAVLTFIAVGALTASVPDTATAQSYEQYCREKAEKLSGYEKRPDNVVGGAVTGAIGGALIDSAFGGNKKSREQAAAVGALLGGVSAANRSSAKAARIYHLEYKACMQNR